MKLPSTVIACVFLLSIGTVAAAEMESLADRQLDSIAAGTVIDVTGNPAGSRGGGVDQDTKQQVDAKIEAGDKNKNNIENKNEVHGLDDALNVVNFVDTSIDQGKHIITETNTLILKDDVQRDAKAFAIQNQIHGKLSNAFNIDVSGIDRNLGSLGSGGIPSLNQSNIVIQNQ